MRKAFACRDVIMFWWFIAESRWEMQYLTHWGRVMHICVSKLTITGPDNGLSAPSHYLNQYWNIVNSNLRNKLQWNFNRKPYISFRKVHFNMTSAKWPPCCRGLNVFNVMFCISDQYSTLSSGLGIQGSTGDHKTYLPRTSGNLSYYLLICGWLIWGAHDR